MPIDDERIRHLRECFDRSIGPDATSTVMSMLTSVDVTNLATKDDIRQLMDRMDHRFEMVDLKFEALNDKLSERIQGLDDKFTERFEGTVHRIEAMVFRSINRHLTFSVMAMAAVSGMFTWLAR